MTSDLSGQLIDVITVHLPQPNGRAAERALVAWVQGARSLGADVRVTSWSGYDPREPVPGWCEHVSLPAQSRAARRLAALRRPRSDVRMLGWAPRPGAWAVADDVVSAAAVAGRARSVLVAHYSTVLDQHAVRRVAPRHVQDLRWELRVADRVDVPTAYSGRVARVYGSRVRTVPIGLLPPAAPVAFVDDPVAVIPADWEWAPNRAALATLLRQWPVVRRRIPDARLLLVGRGSEALPLPDGVTALGHLRDLTELWEQAAVLAFPCPASSGPKVKVLEAAMHGVSVLTTPPGAEGLDLDGVAVSPPHTFADALIELLRDPVRRYERGCRLRTSALAHHAPEVVARRRYEVWSRGAAVARQPLVSPSR
jgi:glycosyltransferase involved in cell wall biosynthesis